MENKNNFMGIIIPVIVAVILLTVLPIVNSMNVECPPCEECPSYDIGQLNINPDFSSGNYIVDKGSYDYIDSATIIKDVDLIPENIKKDINIFGVVGTYEEVGGLTGYTISGTLYGASICYFHFILYGNGTFEVDKDFNDDFTLSNVIYFRGESAAPDFQSGDITYSEFKDANGVVMTKDIFFDVYD